LALQGGQTIPSIITDASADSLELVEGKSASTLIKASKVIIGPAPGADSVAP
jgi:molybdopterin-binding protein